jgi:hypothetical protein
MYLLTFRDSAGRSWVGAAIPGPLRPVGFEAEPIEPADFPSAGLVEMIDFKVVVDFEPADEELPGPEGPSAPCLEGEGETDPMSRTD